MAQVVVNPSFETGDKTGWHDGLYCGCEVVPGGPDGNYQLKCTERQGWCMPWAYQEFISPASGEITLRAWGRCASKYNHALVQLYHHAPEQYTRLIRLRWGTGESGYKTATVQVEEGWLLYLRVEMVTANTSQVGYFDNITLHLPEAVICLGPLAPLCEFFDTAGTFLHDLAGDIRVAWLVGEYLAVPFEMLSDLFYDAYSLCCEVSEALQHILDALELGITPASLLALIQDHWPTLYELITDPVAWLLVQLTLAFDLEPWHTRSLDALAKWILEEYFFTLYLFWLDPGAWIEENIAPLIPTLPDWLADPIGWLTATLQEHFTTLYDLWLDPETWLREHLDPRLLDAIEEIIAFFEDPWGWLLDRFEDVFEDISERLYGLGERVLRFFWEGVW